MLEVDWGIVKSTIDYNIILNIIQNAIDCTLNKDAYIENSKIFECYKNITWNKVISYWYI